MAQKLFAFYVDADSLPELKKAVNEGLAKMGEAGAASGGGKAAGGGASSGGAKADLDAVKAALTNLKTAHDTKAGDPTGKEKKVGIGKVKNVLKKFKVTNSKDLKEEDYAAVVKAATDAMPGDSDEQEEDEDPI